MNTGAHRTILSCFLIATIALEATPSAAQFADIGVSAVRARRFGEPGLPSFEPRPGDGFSSSLAAGDFDGDGVDDLASGIPFHDGVAAATPDTGAVAVRPGVAGRGLDPATARLLYQSGSSDTSEPGEFYGFALASCDFNDDGFDDLAVGVPIEDVGATLNAGGVDFHLGGPTGIDAGGDLFFDQNSFGVPGSAAPAQEFGRALACGDFDGDGFPDLAVGVPFEDVNGAPDSGRVVIVPGEPPPGALDLLSAMSLHQASGGGGTVADAFFGISLATGDFNGDSLADLAIGLPGFASLSGRVMVAFGTAAGLACCAILDDATVGGGSEIADRFGDALAAGDFDGDGFDDLVIGVPFEDLGAGNSIVNAGRVILVPGSAAGPLPGSAQLWTQDAIAGAGTSETNDRFGQAVAVGDFDGDGFDDLAAGAPGEFLLVPEDGTIVVWMGSPSGLTSARQRGVAVGFDGFPGTANQASRIFGAALAAGDFDADGHADLAAGAPFEDEPGLLNVGGQMVLMGSLFSDGFGTSNAAAWSTLVP